MSLLMIVDDTFIMMPEARDYLHLRRSEELKNLRHKLAKEEERELARQVAESKRVFKELARITATATAAAVASKMDTG